MFIRWRSWLKPRHSTLTLPNWVLSIETFTTQWPLNSQMKVDHFAKIQQLITPPKNIIQNAVQPTCGGGEEVAPCPAHVAIKMLPSMSQRHSANEVNTEGPNPIMRPSTWTTCSKTTGLHNQVYHVWKEHHVFLWEAAAAAEQWRNSLVTLSLIVKPELENERKHSVTAAVNWFHDKLQFIRKLLGFFFVMLF